MKKLMIMGAGIYQVPLIRRAREMGIYTIVVSIPGPYPGFECADEVCYINTVDQEAVLAVAREKKIDGIVTAGTDVAVITIGRVCEELSLAGPSLKAAQTATDKFLMKQCFEKAGVRTAKFRQILIDEDPYEKIKDLRYPLIVKAVDSSGSRGITRVTGKEQIPAAIESVRKVTRRPYYLIEEFITGIDYGVQAFVSGGKIRFILPHGNDMFFGDTGVPAGHYVPYDMSSAALKDLEQTVTAAIEAMGLDNCAVNGDLILCGDETYIVEMTARSGATGLSEIDSVYLGCDLYENIILTALREEPVFPADPPKTACAGRLLRSDVTGTVVSVRNGNVGEDPRIIQMVLDYGPGDHVNAFHVGPDRIGQVIARGNTLEEARQTLEEAIDKISFNISPDEGGNTCL